MDYRYYRGDGIKRSPRIVKHLYLLRWIGGLMIASPPILGLLGMFHILQLNLFWFFAGCLLGIFGNVFYILGITYDTTIDRDGAGINQWILKLLGRRKTPQEFRPGRRMIYEHYETPEVGGQGDVEGD